MSKTGFPVVLSAPSGGGKSTIAARLVAALPFLRRSRSVTTRPPRAGEAAGVDYDFVSPDEFARRRAAGAFAEWAEVHGHAYGTEKAFMDAEGAAGRCPLLVIDVQGGRAIKAYDPGALLLFLMPHSLTELEARLRARSTESAEAVERRLRNARKEIAEAHAYDYIVINDRLDDACEQARGLILRRFQHHQEGETHHA